MAQTLFGELLPKERRHSKARCDWSDIIAAYKAQDAKSMAVMAAMLAAVPSMDELQYRNLLEVTANALVNNVTTKESIVVGLVWFIQFVPDETFLNDSCLVGLLRLFIDQLNLAPDLMQPAIVAGLAVIAEILIARRCYQFAYMSSDIKTNVRMLRIQLNTNLKKITEQHQPQYVYLDKLLGELVKNGQDHKSFRPGMDRTANLLFSTALGIMGIVGGLLYLSSPLGWSIAIATVASLALVSNFRKECFDLFWSLKRAIEEPSKSGFPQSEFLPYQRVNQLLLTTMAVNTDDAHSLSWAQIIEVLDKLITQNPHIASYSASRLIDLTASYSPHAVLVVTPLTHFILKQIQQNQKQALIWFSLLCHLNFRGSITSLALQDVIGMDEKHKIHYEIFCTQELDRLKDVQIDQRLWDFRNLNPGKLAAVQRVQQRWVKFQTYNYQLFNTGVLNLLPSHRYHHYAMFIEQLSSHMKKKDRSILLHGPSGSGKSVLTGIMAESFNKQHNNKCIIRVFTFVLPKPGRLSPSATQLHYERQIKLQYEIWARNLAKRSRMPQILSNLHHREGLLLEVTRLLNLSGQPWLLIVENIPDPLYWHEYHHQKKHLSMSSITNTRAHGNTLIVSQKQFVQAENAKHYALINVNTHNLVKDGFQLLNAIYPVKDDTETAAATTLLNMTHCLPAALAMAAVFIKHQCASHTIGRICTYEDYIKLIENYSAILSTIAACNALPYSLAVIAIIKCSIGAIDDVVKRAPVEVLMNFLCSIAEAPITYSMLHHHWQQEQSALSPPIELHEVIIIAERLNLLRRIRISGQNQDTFIVPNLVYEVWSATLKGLSSDVKLQYLQNVMFDQQHEPSRQMCLHEKFTLPHVIALLDNLTQDCSQKLCEPRLIATYGAADTARFWGNNEEAARLFISGLKQLELCQGQGKHYTDLFNAARFEKGLSIVKNLQGHPKSGLLHGERASSHYAHVKKQTAAEGNVKFSLGKINLEMGDFSAAKNLFVDALRYRQEANGETSEAVANGASGLGLLLSTQDRFHEAIIQHKQAVLIHESINPKSEDTATSYHDYGVSLTAMGDYQSAIKLHEASLQLRELTLGMEHHQVATGHNSIGCCYYFMGESLRLSGEERKANAAYNSALGYHESALYSDIERNSLYHPYTIISLLNEARVLIRLKKNGPEVDKALRASERGLCNIPMPSNRVHVLWVMHYIVLAQRHEWQHRYPLAEVNYINALECAKNIYGVVHTQVAAIYYYLSTLIVESGLNVGNLLRYQDELASILSKTQELHSDHWMNHIRALPYTGISYL